MKKAKYIIFGITLGVLLTGSIGVIAYSISASDIAFESSNENFKATNVQGAIDELYELVNNHSGDIKISQSPYGEIYTVPSDGIIVYFITFSRSINKDTGILKNGECIARLGSNGNIGNKNGIISVKSGDVINAYTNSGSYYEYTSFVYIPFYT